MDAWVLVLAVGVSLSLMAVHVKYRSVLFALIGGIVSLLALARLIADDSLVIGHECCNAGADVQIALAQNDLNVVALVLAAFVIAQFAMVIESQMASGGDIA